MEQANEALLRNGLRDLGLEAPEGACTAIARHLALVAEWNERVNLTAITDEREMVLKHALDSAAGLKVVSLAPGTKVIDIGSGAGFPGVTWKCLVPGIDLVLLESLQKRCKVLEAVGDEVIRPLVGSTAGYRVLWSRAEEAGASSGHREQYDVATARAVANLRVLVEYCLPMVKVGGVFVALKGPGVGEEIDAAVHAIQRLGGRVEQCVEVGLPEGAGTRMLVLIRKVVRTPGGYPRKAGTPAKDPL